MVSLESFIQQVPEFDTLSAGRKIDFFVYYYTIVEGLDGVTGKEVAGCFDSLRIPRYSNVPQYLATNAKKGKKKSQKFVVRTNKYHLERSIKAEIDGLLNAPRSIAPTNN